MNNKLAKAKYSLQEVIDYASKLESSGITTSFDSYNNWVFLCNTEIQKIFGPQAAQCKSIYAMTSVQNVMNSSRNDPGSGELRLREISKKKLCLQEILKSISAGDIVDRYMEDELSIYQKISKIQYLMDEADLVLATGKVLNPQYSIWHNKALESLRECFDVTSAQVTTFSSNTLSTDVVDKIMGRSQAEKKFRIQRSFLQEQLTVLERIEERSNLSLSQSNIKNNSQGVTNVTNNINIEGNVSNSAIAAGDGNAQSLTITQEQRNGLEHFLEQARANLPSLHLDSESESDYNDHLSVIEGCIVEDSIQPAVVKKELRGLQRIAESAAGSAIGGAGATAVIEGITAALQYLT